MEPKLERTLKDKLRKAKKIALLGIGSELRGDDAAGVIIAENIINACRKNKKLQKKLKSFIGSTAPENITGEIKKYKPTHLVIIDSVDMNEKPGAVKLIDLEHIEGITFCTHKLPVKILTDYLTKSIGCDIVIIGIQPKQFGFGMKLSKEVKSATEDIEKSMKDILIEKL